MRSTLHLLTLDDYLRVAVALRPAHLRMYQTYHREGARPPDPDLIAKEAAKLFASGPRTFAEIREKLAHLSEGSEPTALSWIARASIPMTQVWTAPAWRSRAAPSYERVADGLAPPEEGLPHLVRRYLAAFGPASRADIAAWSGVAQIRDVLDGLPLRTFKDERGRTLYDLARGPLPAAGVPAPPRFLARCDNVILSHDDRTRVLPKEYAAPVIRMGRMLASFLVDGMVAGTWKVEKTTKKATLVVTAFDPPLARAAREALTDEGERLVRFVEDVASHAVRFD
jgi:hypothetical protein